MLNEMMPFLVALLAGLLIGIERERSKGQADKVPILGVRTFPLLALTGTLVAYLNNDIITVITSSFLGVLILASHIHWEQKKKTWHVSATTAIAAILTFLLGYLAHTHAQIALILAVILFGFLALKTRLHIFAQTGITKEEMSATLTFLISAFVILPLLPNKFIDPWELVHPTRIWVLFVIIAGVEFSSYIALRQFGLKWGILLTGLLGGFASATATTISLAQRYKEQSEGLLLITSGLILAEVSSLLIQIIVLMIIAPTVSTSLFIFLAVPAIVGIGCAFAILILQRNVQSIPEYNIKIKNPISIKNTARFALLISIGLILIALATRWFGDLGVYITSLLGGAISLRVVTFSVSELASSGEILVSVASLSILMAMMMNVFVKLGIIYKAGGMRLFLLSSIFFLIMLASGFVIYFLNIENIFHYFG